MPDRRTRELFDTIQRLAAGDHTARAADAGPVEFRAAVRALNALADEADRLRWEEQENSRLRTLARNVGNRIREHLLPADVVREAHAALVEELGCSLVYVHLVRGGQMGVPEIYRPGWISQDDAPNEVPEVIVEWARDTAKKHGCLPIRDLRRVPPSVVFPSAALDWLLGHGAVSGIFAPFATGTELLGMLSGYYPYPRTWTAAEMDVFVSIADDMGRGLSHARQYEAENRLVEELRAIDNAKTHFLATVSHELRTPLTSIAGYVELLLDEDAGPLTQTQGAMLHTVERNITLLRTLIENVLAISKNDLDTSKVTNQPVNLPGIVDEAVTAMGPVAAAAGVALKQQAAAQPIIVNGDSSQLERLLMNVLSNAVKFTPQGGSVTVTTETDGTSAVTTVTDTGIGIPEKDLKNLFTRFFRASNAAARALPGTGLGLALCRTIARDHGGELDLESEEDAGTTVTVRLPLAASREP